ncbi:hypothetical protein AFLA70_25g005841 [Aspergillus flavus AF70]|nr:hypothetical protein AFLA70_25g005841 [Aspergillus flavus AF70]
MDKLRVINNPPETEIQAVDVVAVHGAAGYKTSTWESLDPGTISYVEWFSGRPIVRVSITKALIQAAFGHDADDQHNEGELENVEGKEYSSDDGDLKGDD